MVKILSVNAGDIRDTSSIPESGGKAMETHYSILAWAISWTEDPGAL